MIFIKKASLLLLLLFFIASSTYFIFYAEKGPSGYDFEEKGLPESKKNKYSQGHKHPPSPALIALSTSKDSEPKSVVKPIDSSYKSSSFSISEVDEREVKKWMNLNKGPEGFTLSTVVLKVHKEGLLKNKKINLPVSKNEFVQIEQTELNLKNKKSFVWHGVDNLNSPYSDVLLSWHEGALTGYLNLSEGISYKVDFFKKDHVIVRKVDLSTLPSKCEVDYSGEFAHKGLKKSSKNRAIASNHTHTEGASSKKVRVLFVYDGLSEVPFSEEEIRSKANGYISSINQVFKDQEISQEDAFELAGIERKDSIPWKDILDILEFLRKDEEVREHKLRYEADLVSLLIKKLIDPCGIGQYQNQLTLLSTQCDNLHIFEHEVGHNFGAGHEKEGCDEQCHGIFDYSHAFRDGGGFKTIMISTHNCKFFTFFIPSVICKSVKQYSSSQGKDHIGNADNDNARTLRETLESVKNYHENWLVDLQPKITKNINSRYQVRKGGSIDFTFQINGENLGIKLYHNNIETEHQPPNKEKEATIFTINYSQSFKNVHTPFTFQFMIYNNFGEVFSNKAFIEVIDTH